MIRPGRPTQLLAGVLLLVACGQPTAQVLQPAESRLSYEIPIDYTELEGDGTTTAITAYGLVGTPLSGVGADPLLLLAADPNGEDASFQSLRLLATGGQFDPLDEGAEGMPDTIQLLGYEEITESDVWGIRLRLLTGPSVSDFQALVDRGSNQIVVTQMQCSQACFVEQRDLIDQIQQSWSVMS